MMMPRKYGLPVALVVALFAFTRAQQELSPIRLRQVYQVDGGAESDYDHHRQGGLFGPLDVPSSQQANRRLSSKSGKSSKSAGKESAGKSPKKTRQVEDFSLSMDIDFCMSMELMVRDLCMSMSM